VRLTRPTARVLVAVAGVVLVLVAVAGLMLVTRPDPVSLPAFAGSPASAAAPADAPIVPARVQVPSIGADSSLIGLGRDGAGGWAVPPVEQPGQASWYDEGPVPGQPGPAVILGHVSGTPAGARSPVPGVFARLDRIELGAEVIVSGTDGRTVRFRVTRVERPLKSAFPTDRVLGPTSGPELRLITCGGTLRHLSDGRRSFDGSVIVYAALA
jgi:Sortase domain